MAVCMAVSSKVDAYASAIRHHAQRYNIVFVMDSSGSMGNENSQKGSDRQKRRFDAVELFLGLATDSGNYIGAVVFNNEILHENEMKELVGNQDKMAFTSELRDVPVGGNTNIGTALLKAVAILDEGANRNLPSAIILLTDGNTELDESEMEKAEKDKEEALEAAQKNHYPVYSICLNEDFSANRKEMQEISQRTQGVFQEIHEANDLKKVFSQFYDMIYGTEMVEIVNAEIPQSGLLESEFQIPEFGVEEVNIIISTLNYETDVKIVQPDGVILTEEAIKQSKISAGTFSVIKIVEPMAGEWKISMFGVPGDSIEVKMLYNADYQICLEQEGETLEQNLRDCLSLKAYLVDGGERFKNAKSYRSHDAVLLSEHNGKVEELLMEALDDGYAAEYKLEDYGTYVFRVSMPINGMEEISQDLTVHVKNNPPVADESLCHWDIKEWSFVKNTYTKDLTDMVSDKENDTLRYKIINYTKDSGLQLDITPDGCMTLNTETEADGIFTGKFKRKMTVTVRATDSQEDSCEFVVDISFTALNILFARILAGVLLAAGICAVFLFIRSRRRRFNGEITVSAFDEQTSGRSRTIEPKRGIVKLSDYILDYADIPLSQVRLKATGKSYIYVISSKGYYNAYEDKRRKKIQLYDGEETVLSDYEDLHSGIKIIYHYKGNGEN